MASLQCYSWCWLSITYSLRSDLLPVLFRIFFYYKVNVSIARYTVKKMVTTKIYWNICNWSIQIKRNFSQKDCIVGICVYDSLHFKISIVYFLNIFITRIKKIFFFYYLNTIQNTETIHRTWNWSWHEREATQYWLISLK